MEEKDIKKIEMREKIKYSFCTCGKSKNLPFCDDSHRQLNIEKETNYKSLKIELDKNVNAEISCSNWKEEIN